MSGDKYFKKVDFPMNNAELEIIKKLYSKLSAVHAEARKKLGRPLTLTEKILCSHLPKWPAETLERGKTALNLYPDRVAMQDATAQMALLQFIVTGLDSVKVPSTVHCDHLIRAESGSASDLDRAKTENAEVYEFLRSASARYGIGFWQPGSGIIHQVVLEQYAFPGALMIGTDSHTPNAGGLGMLAIGIGGADAVDVMAGQALGLTNPKIIGVHLTGKLSGWTAPKDVILKVAELLSVKGGTGAIVEYFGEGATALSCTGKATITNMGAELGATTSVFPYDDKMAAYLKATERADVAELADKHCAELNPDKEVLADPEKYYDQLIEINLSELEPAWVGPHTPDLRHAVSVMKARIKENDYPEEARAALIGSCTNSSYEDITRAASIARQAKEKGLKVKIPFLITPGSDQIYQTMKRDGYLDLFTEVGGTILANACGPCIGQWNRTDIKAGEKNAIVTSYNRNFRKRNDGNTETMAFIGSPELVTAIAFSGKLGFDPRSDSVAQDLRFSEPSGLELPEAGYVFSRDGYLAPQDEKTRKELKVEIAAESERLAFLEPFPAWDGKDFEDLVVLVKALGKCTTDHISQAGPWLKYRGHLDNISNNMFIGAINAFTEEAGKGLNVLTGEKGLSFPEIARHYKAKGQGWVAVGDENYGEGSSREHAAMEPRHLGCKVVLAKSFARIAETNLKKQGVLALSFDNPKDYNLIKETSRLSFSGLTALSAGSKVAVKVTSDGEEHSFSTSHTLTDEQIEWFKAGSALNKLRKSGS